MQRKILIKTKNGEIIELTAAMWTSIVLDGRNTFVSDGVNRCLFMDQDKFVDHVLWGDVVPKEDMWYVPQTSMN